MPTLPERNTPTSRTLFPLIVANGVTVSTLYWAQSLVPLTGREFGSSLPARLMPGATLAGYALGVALLASVAGDLTQPRALRRHAGMLAAGLSLAAVAPNASVAALACLVVGLGCALTQRLLACATSAVPPGRRAATIGWIIASGLGGIVLARACVPPLSALWGWRAMFWTDAALALVCGLAAARAVARAAGPIAPAGRCAIPSAASLWRGERALRRAAAQQALVFALFNMGWAVFPRLLAAEGGDVSLPMGVVATLGAGAALLSGRVCGRWSPADVARTGCGAVVIAAAAFLLRRNASLAGLLDMALLDVGTQVALVANQARAQALASTPAIRGRLAAIVTTIGFGGGAVGAAIGNLLV